MKNIAIILSVCAALGCVSAVQKLQIGIKKRVENCEIKAQKGDLVHMHYTVNLRINRKEISLLNFFCSLMSNKFLLSIQGTLENGVVFDSSIEREQPLTFTLGTGQVSFSIDFFMQIKQ